MSADPSYPDVPKAPGVPDVKRSDANAGTDTQTEVKGDEITVTGYGADEWGVYLASSKAKAIEADNFEAMGFDGEFRIADYPIEEGGFESYDKVATPFHVRVTLTKGGKREDRKAFISKIEELRADMTLYWIVTPESIWRNVNLTRVTIDRSREAGAGLIRADLMFQEVRVNATSSFSNTRDPASASTVNNGTTQAKPVAAPAGGVQ